MNQIPNNPKNTLLSASLRPARLSGDSTPPFFTPHNLYNKHYGKNRGGAGSRIDKGLQSVEETRKIRVFNELTANIVKIRHLRNKYQTNRTIRALAAYYLLKSTTTSGVVKDYSKQLPALLQYMQVSKSSFYSYLKLLESLQLVKRAGGCLVMSSNERLCAIFDITEVSNTTTITYKATGPKFYQLLQTSLIYEQHTKIQKTVESKILAIPELAAALLPASLQAQKDKGRRLREVLHTIQCAGFKSNDQRAEYEAINADHHVTARTLHKLYGFKSYKSVAYLKASIKRAGIATVNKREIISPERARKRKHYVAYLEASKATLWRLPDEINFTPGLYASC